MEILFMAYLFIFWVLFGSFASVIISRLRENQAGIISGKSECPKCHHSLWAKDLIPIFSFLSTKGKCRYCGTKISYFYPFLEICFGILFIATAYFFVDIWWVISGNTQEIVSLFFYLFFWFGTLIYVIYDILYLEIPESILLILIIGTFIALVWQNFWIVSIFPFLENNIALSIEQHLVLISGFVGSILLLYAIMWKGWSYLVDLWILGFIACFWWILFFWNIPLHETIFGSTFLWAFAIFLFLFLQILISNGRAMWWWDLRIAILMGMILWISMSFWWILATYIFWSIIGVIILIFTKTKAYYQSKKKFLNQVRHILGLKTKKIEIDTQIPFWPFLAIGMYVTLLYGNEIRLFLQNYL